MTEETLPEKFQEIHRKRLKEIRDTARKRLEERLSEEVGENVKIEFEDEVEE